MRKQISPAYVKQGCAGARSVRICWRGPPRRERQKVGGQAALRSGSCVCGCDLNFGYQRRNRSSRSSLRTLVLVCSKRWAPTQRPLHLLLLDESFADHLVDRRLHEGRADRLPLMSTLAEVRDELAVIADVCFKLTEAVSDLLRSVRTGMNETQLH